MRATIKNYLDGAQRRREENGDAGFSLIELIVVVAILGILVAVAIPVFGSIQQNAKDGALKSAAASAATIVAAGVANGSTVADINTDLLASQTPDYAFTPLTAVPTDLKSVCVTATAVTGKALDGAANQSAGPGCP